MIPGCTAFCVRVRVPSLALRISISVPLFVPTRVARCFGAPSPLPTPRSLHSTPFFPLPTPRRWPELDGLFSELYRSPHLDVRLTLAAALHDLAPLLARGAQAAAAVAAAYDALLSDTEPEVVAAVARRADAAVRALPQRHGRPVLRALLSALSAATPMDRSVCGHWRIRLLAVRSIGGVAGAVTDEDVSRGVRVGAGSRRVHADLLALALCSVATRPSPRSVFDVC